ncbi:MAG: hypothetical protein IT334_10565 [Thermomicrobiales bacterium]|nr:hypothetical protein [Thermomicrobiales bacterium]
MATAWHEGVFRAGRYTVETASAPDGYLPYDVPLAIRVLANGDQQFVRIPFARR